MDNTTETSFEMLANPLFHFLSIIDNIEIVQEDPERDPKRYDADFKKMFPEYKGAIGIFHGFVAGFDAANKLWTVLLDEKESSDATTTETTK